MGFIDEEELLEAPATIELSKRLAYKLFFLVKTLCLFEPKGDPKKTK